MMREYIDIVAGINESEDEGLTLYYLHPEQDEPRTKKFSTEEELRAFVKNENLNDWCDEAYFFDKDGDMVDVLDGPDL